MGVLSKTKVSDFKQFLTYVQIQLQTKIVVVQFDLLGESLDLLQNISMTYDNS